MPILTISFNPLPSHEGRHNRHTYAIIISSFQSTSLSRGKTQPRSSAHSATVLSIHFPLTREDAPAAVVFSSAMSFQSTSLSRGKTRLKRQRAYERDLSIHFPLTREDSVNRREILRCTLSIHFPLTREDYAVLYYTFVL